MNDQTFDYTQYEKMPLSMRKMMIGMIDRLAPEAGSAAYMMVYEHDPDPELREIARQKLEANGVRIGETDRPTEGNPGETHYQVDDPSQEGTKTIALDGGDGRVRTPAQLADTPNLFILDRNQRKRLSGDVYRPSRTALYTIAGFTIVWTIVLIALVVPGIRSLGRNPTLLIFLGVGALVELLAIAGLIQNIRRQRLFETQGKLLQGQIIGATGRWVRHSDTDSDGHRRTTRSFDVTIGYTFRTPNGQKLTSSSTRTRGDLKNEPMPESGTPVAVLYVDDKTFMLL